MGNLCNKATNRPGGVGGGNYCTQTDKNNLNNRIYCILYMNSKSTDVQYNAAFYRSWNYFGSDSGSTCFWHRLHLFLAPAPAVVVTFVI